MSYILDALNKSEQERQQREHGITLQPLTGVPHGEPRTTRWLPWVGLGIVVAAALVFAAVYLWMQGRQLPVTAAPAPTVNAAASAVPASRVPASQPPASASRDVAPAVGAPAASTAATVAPPERSVAAPAVASDSVRSLYQRKAMTAEQARADVPATVTEAAPSTTDTVKTFGADAPAAVRTAEVEAAAPAPAAGGANLAALQAALQKQREAELAARVQSELEALQARDASAAERAAARVPQPAPAQAVAEPTAPLATELAPALQQRIPTIEFGAHVYAGRTGNGFVILNGKKRYAGDPVAPGLTVERVTEDGVILDLGGTRFKLESMRSWFNN